MRLFLDANVVFSAAHNPDGNGRALFQLAAARRGARLISSRFAIEEAARNIALKYPERLSDLERLTADLEVCAEPTPSAVAAAASVGLPAKDAPILAAAIGARARVLVTGDRQHFSPLFGKTIEGVTVIMPAEAVVMLLALAPHEGE